MLQASRPLTDESQKKFSKGLPAPRLLKRLSQLLQGKHFSRIFGIFHIKRRGVKSTGGLTSWNLGLLLSTGFSFILTGSPASIRQIFKLVLATFAIKEHSIF